MKIRTIYTCEICGWDHRTEQSARDCEAQGKGPTFPIGMIFGDSTGFYKNMTFAVAKNGLDGHSNQGALWACRDSNAGDSLSAKDICGGNSISPSRHDAPNVNHPTFARIVALVQKFGIAKKDITVWDGTKPVPLAEYVKA